MRFFIWVNVPLSGSYNYTHCKRDSNRGIPPIWRTSSLVSLSLDNWTKHQTAFHNSFKLSLCKRLKEGQSKKTSSVLKIPGRQWLGRWLTWGEEECHRRLWSFPWLEDLHTAVATNLLPTLITHKAWAWILPQWTAVSKRKNSLLG